MPGPAKMAPELKVLAGTFRKGRDAPTDKAGPETQETDSAPRFDLVEQLPALPRGLRGEGRAMWRTLGPILVRCGQLQKPDLYAFEQLCRLWGDVKRKWENGTTVTPAENTMLNTLFNSFGINPTARRRVVRYLAPPAPAGAGKPNRFAGHGKRPGGQAP